MESSERIKQYFDYLESNTQTAYSIAKKARKKGYDPSESVEIKLAKNMAERVVGIISVVAPQIIDSGVVERILELENMYSPLDWRVAFVIALEIAQEKFCKFKDKVEAIEVGVRTGFAYGTVGVVSSPLEGLTSIDILKRRDGKGEYFRINYAGPIRNAGGTNAAVSVLIADYVRKKLGYAKYDPDEKEIRRCYAELEDYHQYVANLQYFPSKEETEFMLNNMPVEIAGDPSEKRELSNASLKDLPRVETNLLRSGYCLIHSSCIPLKAPKLWKQLSKWGHDMEMDDWNFLEEFIKLQKNIKANKVKSTDSSNTSQKVKPDGVFVQDLVGGRPVLGHPMRSGGFRLRYGRSRASGYSGQSIHPATTIVLNGFIATGTQLKVERPGKAAAFTPCDMLEGPIVKLKDGSVRKISSEQEANEVDKIVEEILYLGDVLINYGDFFDRAHILVPPGYCEEFWILEVKEAIEKKYNNDVKEFLTKISLSEEAFDNLIKNPIRTKVSFLTAQKISLELNVPIHPSYDYYYNEISKDELILVYKWLLKARVDNKTLILPKNYDFFEKSKRALELLGIPHTLSIDGSVVLTFQTALSIIDTFSLNNKSQANKNLELIISKKSELVSALDLLNLISPFKIRDKSGIFIGSRMGRPEKAKMRQMKGSPHSLFPVGEEGGRMRSFQAAMQLGRINSSFPYRVCTNCKNVTPLSICEMCESKTIAQLCDLKSGETFSPEVAAKMEGRNLLPYKYWPVDIRGLFDYCLKKMNTKIYPDLIKGVKGTVAKEHLPEHLLKGILRAKHSICVNKDGTIRYDASEVTLTHFKPKEVGTSIVKLKELGYNFDVYGKPLESEDQVLELLAQDVVLPACKVSPNEGCDEILLRTTKFVDDELKYLYGLDKYYNIDSVDDLAGQLVVGLAPHTSAGTVGRIVGFSKTQAFFAHPLFHAAMRRDCDGDESCVFLLMDAFLNFSQKYLGTSRGSTMDAPLVLTTILNPGEVDDMAFNVDRVFSYPLEFYKACLEYKYPWDVKIEKIGDVLFTEKQFEGMGFTHDTDDLNAGILCSAYKTLPSMAEKIECQMDLAVKIRAVDTSDVARLIIEKHFIRDTKGNLRKFSLQQFRCVNCNEKYRRPPLSGKCPNCGGKIIFTISEGSIIKYLEMSIGLAEKYNVSNYLKQSLYLTKKRIIDVFGEEKEKQSGLGDFINA